MPRSPSSARRIPALLRRGGRSPVAGGGGAVDSVPLADTALFALDSRYGVTRANGLVSSWVDRVYGHDFVQATDSRKPEYSPTVASFGSRPGVYIRPSSTRFLNCASGISAPAGDYTVYVLYEGVTASATTQTIVDVSAGRLVWYARAGTDQLAAYHNVGLRTIGTGTYATGRQLLTYKLENGLQTQAWRDGVSVGTTAATYTAQAWGGSTTIGSTPAGATTPVVGWIAAIYAYAGAHTAEQRAVVEAYLDAAFTAPAGAAYRVAILSGQSNAQGNVYESELTDSSLLSAYSAVPWWYHVSANAEQPSDQESSALSSLVSLGDWAFGMELKMGRDLDAAKTSGDEVVICKVTKGATASSAWVPGVGAQWLWCEDAWDGLCEALRARGDREIIPVGLVWSQGESDANSAAVTQAGYQANLAAIVAGWRRITGTPDLYTQVVLLNPSWPGDPTGMTNVRAAQEAFVLADANAGAIDADALGYHTVLPYPGHYTADALMTQGEWAAAAIVAAGKMT